VDCIIIYKVYSPKVNFSVKTYFVSDKSDFIETKEKAENDGKLCVEDLQSLAYPCHWNYNISTTLI
jgi:hypothetical protein